MVCELDFNEAVEKNMIRKMRYTYIHIFICEYRYNIHTYVHLHIDTHICIMCTYVLHVSLYTHMYTCTYDLMYQERPFLMGRSPDWEARDLTLDLARLLMCRDPKQVTFSLWTT